MISHGRREFLKLSGFGAAGAMAAIAPQMAERAGAQDAAKKAPAGFDVKAFGAKGDGVTIDTPAINRAIETAAASGGGTVRLRAGNYLCYSIHLKSDVALFLDQGAVIIAADPLPEGQPGG
jgi:polygalacturonase